MIKIPRMASDRTIIGTRWCVYDAWNRLVSVWDDDGDGTQETSGGSPDDTCLATMTYDGLGRRIKKVITNSGDWNGTYDYYYNGHRMIETRNGANLVIKQHVWGMLYVDELVQIGLNDDPTDEEEGPSSNQCLCETFLYAAQDANFNVTNLFESDGALAERYAYTRYGERQVYKPADEFDDFGTEAIPHSQPHAECPDLVKSLCDVGHQGLLHDKEIGLIHNRARTLHPRLGRFLQRDPLGYVDAMSLYEYVRSGPLSRLDPSGSVNMEFKGIFARYEDSIYDSGIFSLAVAKETDVCGKGSKFRYLVRATDHGYDYDWVFPRYVLEWLDDWGVPDFPNEAAIVKYLITTHYARAKVLKCKDRCEVPDAGDIGISRARGVRDTKMRDLKYGYDKAVDLGIEAYISAGTPAVARVVQHAGARTSSFWRSGRASRGRAGIAGRKVVFKTRHAARHLRGTGVTWQAVERAVRRQIGRATQGASATGNFWGRVTVGGRVIEYRGYTLANGTISVGTTYPPPVAP